MKLNSKPNAFEAVTSLVSLPLSSPNSTGGVDFLCYFKLMLTDFSRCSKSPETAVLNNWLSMELGHGGDCEIASFKH